MNIPPPDHSPSEINRRRFLKLSAIGSSLGLLPSISSAEPMARPPGSVPAVTPSFLPGTIDPEIQEYLKKTQYVCLTPSDKHGINYHGKVRPWTLPADKIKAAGWDRDSWRVEIVAKDKDTPGAFVDQPRTIAGGNAITVKDLIALMEQRPVKFLKNMTCTNAGSAYGHALWEGVALRDVLWLARPRGAIRQGTFHSYEVDEPGKPQWVVTLPAARIFEDPPGLPPIIVALKLNGELLPMINGGPVRMIIPEAYGTKNLKFVRKIILSNEYEMKVSERSNDLESPMKTCVQRIMSPAKGVLHPQGAPLILMGVAQVGGSGLRGVQYAFQPADPTGKLPPPPNDDPFLTKLDWKDAKILPPQENFGAGLPGGPAGVHGIDPSSGQPLRWPILYFVSYFASVIRHLPPAGSYFLHTRSIDERGLAQPLPRAFGNATGVNDQITHPVPIQIT